MNTSRYTGIFLILGIFICNADQENFEQNIIHNKQIEELTIFLKAVETDFEITEILQTVNNKLQQECRKGNHNACNQYIRYSQFIKETNSPENLTKFEESKRSLTLLLKNQNATLAHVLQALRLPQEEQKQITKSMARFQAAQIIQEMQKNPEFQQNLINMMQAAQEEINQ